MPASLGLSPRVRGNLDHIDLELALKRSIPACAGEPSINFGAISLTRVYPRVCGGTSCASFADSCANGLSPRVRGNHKERVFVPQMERSIPACAGEPQSGSEKAANEQVYPRVCGGTGSRVGAAWGCWGLSPRVRGNLYTQLVIHTL